MSAELLRRAAEKMRERALAATPGPWETGTTHTAGVLRVRMDAMHPCAWPNDAEHIASWEPLVALAVADWLETTHRDTGTSSTAYKAAEVVARAYLGES